MLNVSLTIDVSRGRYLFLSSSCTWHSSILSFLFIMTVVDPLSAFLMFISEFVLSSLIALCSLCGRLCFGFDNLISARSVLTPSR